MTTVPEKKTPVPLAILTSDWSTLSDMLVPGLTYRKMVSNDNVPNEAGKKQKPIVYAAYYAFFAKGINFKLTGYFPLLSSHRYVVTCSKKNTNY